MEQSSAQIAYGVVVDEESGVGMDRVEPSRKSSQVVVTQVSAKINSNQFLPPSFPSSPSLPRSLPPSLSLPPPPSHLQCSNFQPIIKHFRWNHCQLIVRQKPGGKSTLFTPFNDYTV